MPDMRIGTLRRGRTQEAGPGVAGTARLDRRTKNLTKRLRPGDIAVIDHVDIDRVSADALVGCKVAAVVNAAPSISGRYPNLGPEILLAAGIPLLDDVGREVFTRLKEGTPVRLDGAQLLAEDGTVLAEGIAQDDATVSAAMAEAKAGLSVQLEAFAANTMEYMKRERALLLDGVGVPDVATAIEGRHVLVVVRGYDYKEDLAALRPYIRDYRPVLIGVDGGADALVEAGYSPDMIVGDMDSVSDDVLRSGAEVVVHAYADGRAPGLAGAASPPQMDPRGRAPGRRGGAGGGGGGGRPAHPGGAPPGPPRGGGPGGGAPPLPPPGPQRGHRHAAGRREGRPPHRRRR